MRERESASSDTPTGILKIMCHEHGERLRVLDFIFQPLFCCCSNCSNDMIQTETRFKRTFIYYDTDTQSANFRGNLLCQAVLDLVWILF